MLRVFVQGQGLADVRHRQSRHQSHAGVLRSGRMSGGHAQQNHAVAGLVRADGHLALPVVHGVQKWLRVRHVQGGAVESLKGPVHPVEGQVVEAPRLGVLDQDLLLLLVLVDGLCHYRTDQNLHLAQAQVHGRLEVHCDLLAGGGHVHPAHLMDGLCALLVQKNGQSGKDRHAEHQDQRQADL